MRAKGGLGVSGDVRTGRAAGRHPVQRLLELVLTRDGEGDPEPVRAHRSGLVELVRDGVEQLGEAMGPGSTVQVNGNEIVVVGRRGDRGPAARTEVDPGVQPPGLEDRVLC